MAAGGVIGLIGWALLGLGMVELGGMARFDPAGVLDDPPPATTLVRCVELSYPAFAVLGALLFPRAVAWLTAPSAVAAER